MKTKTESNWDPKPSERRYYRSAETGDRAYMVVRDGQDILRLDRPMEEIYRKYDAARWSPEVDIRPLSQAQVAQVALEADKKLCFYLGMQKEGRRDWLGMRQEERIDWMDNGPPEPEVRRKIFFFINKILGDYSG